MCVGARCLCFGGIKSIILSFRYSVTSSPKSGPHDVRILADETCCNNCCVYKWVRRLMQHGSAKEYCHLCNGHI